MNPQKEVIIIQTTFGAHQEAEKTSWFQKQSKRLNELSGSEKQMEPPKRNLLITKIYIGLKKSCSKHDLG